MSNTAQYLELQVWYPTDTLSTSEGDKGFRYQIELTAEGASDNSDSRVVTTNKTSLQVESLGGRDQAALLPVPL